MFSVVVFCISTHADAPFCAVSILVSLCSLINKLDLDMCYACEISNLLENQLSKGGIFGNFLFLSKPSGMGFEYLRESQDWVWGGLEYSLPLE